ncbi:MAG: sigma-70 family RNA polymerase sigma factor [Thermosipho sp. (in: Bacteria)]|nr:sigma-70 family RNA polymerase sigma factor [Thermosipho sp. (in: thermotogales)]
MTKTERDKMFEENMGLAKSIVFKEFKNFAHTSGMTLEDVLQVAYIGLLKAVDKFDASRGLAFSTFAVPTIRGEILRYMRDYSPNQIKISRSIKMLYTKYNKLKDEGKTDEEIMKELEVSREELENIKVSKLEPVYLDDTVNNNKIKDDNKDIYRIDRLTNEYDLAESTVNLIDLREKLALLRDEVGYRNFEILMLERFEEMNQEKIANMVGVTQVQVSRIVKRIQNKFIPLVEQKYNNGKRSKNYKGENLMSVKERHKQQIEVLINWCLNNKGKKLTKIREILEKHNLDVIPGYETVLKRYVLEELNNRGVVITKVPRNDRGINFWVSTDEELKKYTPVNNVIDLTNEEVIPVVEEHKQNTEDESPTSTKTNREVLKETVNRMDIDRLKKLEEIKSANKIVIFNYCNSLTRDTISPIIDTMKSILEISELQDSSLEANIVLTIEK